MGECELTQLNPVPLRHIQRPFSTMSDYRFCPRCATPLAERADAEHEGGRVRQVCPDETCGYVHWNNPLPVVAAIVEYEGKILLARNAAWPEGMFALITGFLENGETPEEGIAREVREETSLQAETVELSLLTIHSCFGSFLKCQVRLSPAITFR
jgi:NADH pyrophosphatase NudC (nudix superfamily)